MEESPAYEEGWAVYHQDLDRTDNPYDDAGEPDAFRDWMRGWTDALEKAEEGSLGAPFLLRVQPCPSYSPCLSHHRYARRTPAWP
jgi:hypothetical protein